MRNKRGWVCPDALVKLTDLSYTLHMNVATVILGVGCHRKAEAAFRFLHGVLRVDTGHVAWSPEASAPETSWEAPPELWRVQAISLSLDTDQLSWDCFLDAMALLVEDQEQSVGQPLCHRKVLSTSEALTYASLVSMVDRRHLGWQPWLFENVAFLREPDDLQDFFVCHPESEYSESVIWPCLRRLYRRIPQQFNWED